MLFSIITEHWVFEAQETLAWDDRKGLTGGCRPPPAGAAAGGLRQAPFTLLGNPADSSYDIHINRSKGDPRVSE